MRGYIFQIDVIFAILLLMVATHVQMGNELDGLLNLEHKTTQVCYALQMDSNYSVDKLISEIGVKGVEFGKMYGNVGNLVSECNIIVGNEVKKVKVYS